MYLAINGKYAQEITTGQALNLVANLSLRSGVTVAASRFHCSFSFRELVVLHRHLSRKGE